MLKRCCILCLCVAVMCSAFAQDTLRVMTYNIHFGSDTSLAALGEYIKQFNPDLVALQEMDIRNNRSNSPHTNGVNVLSELAAVTEMIPVFGKAMDHPSGGYYGDAILSKYDILKTEVYILPRSGKEIEPREIVLSHLNIKGREICFASTHLSHENRENRELQLRQVSKLMDKQKEKVQIVCGDFNSDPSEELVVPLMKKWNDALSGEGTFATVKGAWHKRYKYDYILYRTKGGHVSVANSFVECIEDYSDHCVGVVDIVLR